MVARSSQPRSCPSVWLETSIVLSQKVKRVSLAKLTLRALLDAFFVLKSKYLMRKNSHLCRTGSRGRTRREADNYRPQRPSQSGPLPSSLLSLLKVPCLSNPSATSWGPSVHMSRWNIPHSSYNRVLSHEHLSRLAFPLLGGCTITSLLAGVTMGVT